MAKYFLKMNTTDAHTDRAIMNLNCNFAGRAGEIANTYARQLHADTAHGMIQFDWSSEKTGKVKFCSAGAHVDNFLICPLHALFCHVVATAYQQREHWVFHGLNAVSKPSMKVGAILKTFHKNAPASLTKLVDPAMVPKSARVGTTNRLADSPVGLNGAVARGDWDVKGLGAVFEYIIQTPTTDRKCARWLVGASTYTPPRRS